LRAEGRDVFRRISLVLAAAALAIAAAVASRGTPETPGTPTVPAGYELSLLARVQGARELAAAPNGDLIVGTLGSDVFIVPSAEDAPGEPRVFAHIDDAPVAGVALGAGALFIGGQFGVWRVAYAPGDRAARGAPLEIAHVRTSGTAHGHMTTSVAVADGRLYAAVGSSCNVCDPELDDTRATVQVMGLDGTGMHPKAVHIRNAIALAVNPASGMLWAAVAGQDELPAGHPYEIFDPVTAHQGTVDYGWPYCYENHRAAQSGHECLHQTPPRVVFPAYETPIGAAFYPTSGAGRYAFPSAYAGGAFVALHGSWHAPPVPPRVVFVPLHGEEPASAVDWNDPTVQWHEFVKGFQQPSGLRIGRPTGVAVGPQGSLFVADDKAGVIYRIRPNATK
jgi:glucose/arabinose dehydrogenase